MQHGLILTLGGIESWILIALLVAPAIAGWIKKTKKDQQDRRRLDEGPEAMELEQIAARRREQLRQASQQRAQANLSGGPASAGGTSPGNLSMAERIARARAKAQYEQRAQGTAAQVDPAGAQVPNEAQRRALEQRQAELERRREAAAQQQRQQRAQAQQQAKQQARQRQAQAHKRAQARARKQGRLVHEAVAVPEPTSSSPRRLVPSKPKKRPEALAQPVLIEEPGDITGGNLTRNDLRRAIIMNEVLSKPLALRENGGW